MNAPKPHWRVTCSSYHGCAYVDEFFYRGDAHDAARQHEDAGFSAGQHGHKPAVEPILYPVEAAA